MCNNSKNQPRGVPEGEEGLLGQTRAGRCDGEDEGGESECAVNGYKAGTEGGSGGLAAEQQQEAEEPSDVLQVKQQHFPLLSFETA